ncbi:MAG: hypothetical protein U0556_11390 [Dehalococcoidia bacterium]
MTVQQLRALAAAFEIVLLDEEIEATLAELNAMLANARRLAERLALDDEPGLRPAP